MKTEKRIVKTIPYWMFAVSVVMAASFSFDASGQKPYPQRVVTIVVPWPAGGAADFLARVVGQKLSERWGSPVVIDNRAGAATNIGTELVAKAQPDGHTLLMASSNNCVNMTLFKELRYDIVRDFAPITNVGLAPNILVIHPSLPAKTVRDLIVLAKARPGELTYGSSGSGSAAHLGAEQLKLKAGIDLLGVPYKGAAPAVADLVGGHVSIMFTVIPATLPHVRSGRLRAIAMATLQRLPEFPDLPTVAESGLAGFESSIWYGVVAPAAAQKELVSKLHSDIAAILRSAEVSQRLVSQGTYPIADTPEQFGATIKADIGKYAGIIKAAEIKIE